MSANLNIYCTKFSRHSCKQHLCVISYSRFMKQSIFGAHPIQTVQQNQNCTQLHKKLLFMGPPCVTICHRLCVTTACHCGILKQKLRTQLFRECHQWIPPSTTGTVVISLWFWHHLQIWWTRLLTHYKLLTS